MSARQVLGISAVGLLVVGAAVLPRVAGRASEVDGGSGRPGADALQLRLAAPPPEPACPGPETLVVPDGAERVPPPAPVRILAAALPMPGQGFAAGPLQQGGWQARPLAAANTGRTADLGHPADPGDPRDPVVAAGTAAGPGAWSLRPTGPGAAGAATPVGALQLTLARSGDLRGLAARSCAPAASEAWLVGGGTAAGQRARLLLVNPTAGAAVVDVRLHGPDGPLDSAGTTGLVLPARGERAVFLDALVAGRSRLAVEVVARSGRVLATLHDSVLNGLAPGGTDDVVASARPAGRQLVPGLALRAAGPRTVPGLIRLVVPGREAAVVRVRLFGRDGEVRLAGPVVTVPAGGVTDVPLRGVPSGDYTAAVESDVAVVAAALAGRAPAAGRARAAAEFGWAPSASPLTGAALVPVPAGGVTSRIVLGAAAGRGGASVRVTRIGAGNDDGIVTVPDGHSVSLEIPSDAQGVLLTPTGGRGVVAALVLSASDPAGELLSVLAISGEAPAAGGPVTAVSDRHLGLG